MRLSTALPIALKSLALPKVPGAAIRIRIFGALLDLTLVEIGDALAHRHRLRLDSGIHFELHASSHSFDDALADNRGPVATHQYGGFVPKSLR
jgi:hypothetical protein